MPTMPRKILQIAIVEEEIKIKKGRYSATINKIWNRRKRRQKSRRGDTVRQSTKIALVARA